MSGRSGPEPAVTAGDGDPDVPTPHDRPPWRVLVLLVPIVVVLVVVAGGVGFAYGKPAGEAHVKNTLADKSRDGVRTPVPRPSKIAPEPFISSMPRPKLTRLNTTAPPVRLVGPAFNTDQRTQTLSPNLPFSFRAPAGKWQVDTPLPRQDIAFADAYSKPTGTETAATSPLRAAFAWRACGKCSGGSVTTFDEQFRKHHDAPAVELSRKSSRTSYAELDSGATYYLIVRHLFDGSDGRTYLVEFLTQAPAADRQQAQQLANEILTQIS